MKTRAGTTVGLLLVMTLAGAAPASATPTCSEEMGIAVHGQHVVHDYVVGEHGAWPPGGAEMGAVLKGRGAAVPGGPGPGFHFIIGAAPGASFCNAQSSSPGFHL